MDFSEEIIGYALGTTEKDTEMLLVADEIQFKEWDEIRRYYKVHSNSKQINQYEPIPLNWFTETGLIKKPKKATS